MPSLGSHTRPQKYSEDEISLFEAKWWRDCDGHVLRPAIARVGDPSAPTLHRLQMAVLALVVADNYSRRSEAERVAEVVESLHGATPREDIEKCKAQLIYHTAFGRLERAIEVGTRLVESERRSGNSASIWKALRWIGRPLCLTGELNAAVAALTEAYYQASQLNLRGEMWNAAYSSRGWPWIAKSSVSHLNGRQFKLRLPKCNDSRSTRLGAHYTNARIEFMRGDIEQSRCILDRSRNVRKAIPGTRGEQSILALDVLLRLRSESPRVPQAMLQRLYRLHVSMRESGIRDFETAGIVAGLLYSGERTEAQAVYSGYMAVRRSLIPTHSMLQLMQSTLDVRRRYYDAFARFSEAAQAAAYDL